MPTLNCVSDGTTDVTTPIQDAINATLPNETLFIPPSIVNYKITRPLTINKPMDVVGPRASIWQTTSDKQGVIISSSNVSLVGLQLVGPQYQLSKVNEKAIEVSGTSATQRLSGIRITSCNLASWGQNGFYGKFLDDWSVENCVVSNIWLSAIGGLSVNNGRVSRNKIFTVTGSPNAYGINMTRLTNEAGDLTTNPRSNNIDIDGNEVWNVLNWEGIDTHSGSNILIRNNRLFGCKRGICAVESKNSANQTFFAPFNVIVSNNLVNSMKDDGTATEGLVVSGGSNLVGNPWEYAEGVSLLGNTVIGYGTESAAGGSAVYILSTRGLIMCGNEIINPGKMGIQIYHTNQTFHCYGNTVQDVWSNTLQSIGINIASAYNAGTCDRNTFSRGSKVAPKVMDIGLNIANQVGNRISWVKDYWNPADFAAGAFAVIDGGNKRV